MECTLLYAQVGAVRQPLEEMMVQARERGLRPTIKLLILDPEESGRMLSFLSAKMEDAGKLNLPGGGIDAEKDVANEQYLSWERAILRECDEEIINHDLTLQALHNGVVLACGVASTKRKGFAGKLLVILGVPLKSFAQIGVCIDENMELMQARPHANAAGFLYRLNEMEQTSEETAEIYRRAALATQKAEVRRILYGHQILESTV